ncbi:MAG: sigma-70 family RNA polymerase sigma factor [Treponema sp.]|uniref:sigma-70 family RNA polymerase sigma factor n=1 Tax=Treponema sp. TaxID=166 RepID=UPI003FA21CBD
MQYSDFEKMPEQELFNEYRKTKDLELRNFLVMKHSPIIKHIIGKIGTKKTHRMENDDLFNYGVIGLIDAINKYNPEKDNRFITYAFYRIQGAIFDGIRAYDYASRRTRRLSKKIEQTREVLETRLGRTVTQKEVAKEMGMNDKLFQDLYIRVIRSDTILFTDVKEDKPHCLSIEERLKSRVYYDPEAVIQDDIIQSLKQFIRTLPKRKRKIFIMYYYHNMTFRAISKVFGVSESRIWQIHRDIKKQLQTFYKDNYASH